MPRSDPTSKPKLPVPNPSAPKPFTPIVGEPFNGYKRLHNLMIPWSLATDESLSWFDKCLYGRLRFIAGNSDHCKMLSGRVATELKVSDESVQRSLDRLIKAGLLRRKRLQSGLFITFLWSEKLAGSLPRSSRSESAEERNLDGKQEPAESAPERIEIPLSSGSDSAAKRNAYIEEGFSSGLPKDKTPTTVPPCIEVATSDSENLVGVFFDFQWWKTWSAKKGTNHRSAARSAFLKFVAPETLTAVTECTASYLASLSDPTRGYNPENFLREQAKEHFAARWPEWKPYKTAAQTKREEVLALSRYLRELKGD